MFNSSDPKLAGVRTNIGQQDTERNLPPKKLLALVPLQFFAARYTDDQGKAHSQMMAYDGVSTVYFIGTEAEASRLSIATPWLTEQVKRQVGTGGPAERLPTSDEVDVMAGPTPVAGKR